MSRKARVGSLNTPPPRIKPRNETSSSAFHDTTATQSKKPHHITTMPLRISRNACRISMGPGAGSLLPGPAALSVPWYAGRYSSCCPLVGHLPHGEIMGGGRWAPARQDTMRAGRDEMQEFVVFGFHPVATCFAHGHRRRTAPRLPLCLGAVCSPVTTKCFRYCVSSAGANCASSPTSANDGTTRIAPVLASPLWTVERLGRRSSTVRVGSFTPIQPRRGRRLYGLQLSFTPGRPQKATQQSLESERR